MKAMLVDDSSTMRRILYNTLKKMDLDDIQEAGEGTDALAKLEKSLPDFMLVDWNMPKMDGLTLVKKIRANSQLKDIKIIMVTSESEKCRVLEAVKAGANDYITKPFSEKVLQEKLEEMGLVG